MSTQYESTEKMTKDERSLLLFLEDAMVNKSGAFSPAHINNDDQKILDEWNELGFVESGRVKFKYIKGGYSRWCRLSDEAWMLAHQERKARAKRLQLRRGYATTDEDCSPYEQSQVAAN